MPKHHPRSYQRAFFLGGVSYRTLAIAALGISALYSPLPARAQEILPDINVESTVPNDYQPGAVSLPKLTEPLRDTPQSITVVPRQLMDDKGVTSMTDALRSVPGVSLQAGEAGAQGDTLSLRGFSSRNDIFLDGMRDFGSYYRDAFDYDSVEVLKGPSSVLFGRGSTGGVVNQVSKTAHLGNDNRETVSIGDNNLFRSTADVNMQLDDTSALRINVMGNSNQVNGRDDAQYDRYGFAASYALGLGTNTRTTFNYLHQTENDTPDYGIPWLFNGPAPVNYSNYYGFNDGSNYLDTTADILTGKVEHDVDSSLTLRNQTRVSYYTRKVRVTEPQIPAGVNPATPLSAITVTRNQIATQSQETFAQNQTDVTKKFSAGDFDHTFVGGVEFGRETSDPLRLTYNGVPGTPLLNPNPSQPFSYTSAVLNATNGNVTTTAYSAGAYAIDTVKINPQWEVTGGLRYDYFDSRYSSVAASGATTNFNRVDKMPSYRADVVYKPEENGSIYVAYGTSFNPSAEGLSIQAANSNTAPEKNKTYETGTKWDLFGERLSLRSAIYQLEKTNARVPDPTNTGQNIVDGAQRVQGLEAEAAGRVTEAWQIYGGYNYMDGKVTKGSNLTANSAVTGAPLTNAPHHTFTLWNTYDFDKQWQVGGGMTYVSQRVSRNTGTYEYAPGYKTFDAMAKYKLTENVDVQLNVYNLFDERYLDLLHPSHSVPGATRTFMLTTSFKL
jgi:catecholate siderophore receptor